MAAIAVPSFVGYVDKAKEHQIISETRQIVQAVQMITSEGYAKDKSYEPNFGDPSETVLTANAIKNLCEIDVSSGLTVTFDSTNKVKIDTLTWTNGSTCTYNGGTYTVS